MDQITNEETELSSTTENEETTVSGMVDSTLHDHNLTAESSRTSGESIELSRSSNINIALSKHGRSLMGQSESSERENARALEMNPWGKSTSWNLSSNTVLYLVIPIILKLQFYLQ